VIVHFIRESLFECFCSLELSKTSETLALIEAVEIVKTDQSVSPLYSNLRDPTSSQLFEELAERREVFFERLVTAIYHRYKNTGNVCCIEFLVDFILKQKGHNILQVLGVYYNYYEKRRFSISSIERCRLASLYEKIHKHIKIRETDK
jgi:hypothetical protein